MMYDNNAFCSLHKDLLGGWLGLDICPTPTHPISALFLVLMYSVFNLNDVKSRKISIIIKYVTAVKCREVNLHLTCIIWLTSESVNFAAKIMAISEKELHVSI